MSEDASLDIIDQRSLERCFPGLCRCGQCMEALSSKSVTKPCWFMSERLTAQLLHQALLAGVRGELRRGLKDREVSMTIFKLLTMTPKMEHDMSDLQHLIRIPMSQLMECIRSYRKNNAQRSNAVSMLIECAHLLHLCAYKCDRTFIRRLWHMRPMTCHEATTVVFNQPMSKENYEHLLVTMRKCLASMTLELMLYAFLPIDFIVSIDMLPEFNVEYCLVFPTIYAMQATSTLNVVDFSFNPWFFAFKCNFSYTLKFIWTHASEEEKIERFTFFYPSVTAGKMEINFTLFPRLTKRGECAVCRARLKVRSTLFGIEFSGCCDMSRFPREVLRLERDEDKWHYEPEVSCNRTVVALVCSQACLMRNERAKYPQLHRFLKQFEDAKELTDEKVAEALNDIPTFFLKELARNCLRLKIPIIGDWSDGVDLLIGFQGYVCDRKQKPTLNTRLRQSKKYHFTQAKENKPNQIPTEWIEPTYNSSTTTASSITTSTSSNATNTTTSANKKSPLSPDEEEKPTDEQQLLTSCQEGRKSQVLNVAFEPKANDLSGEKERGNGGVAPIPVEGTSTVVPDTSQLKSPKSSVLKPTSIEQRALCMQANRFFDDIRQKILSDKSKEPRPIQLKVCLKCNKPAVSMKVCAACRVGHYCSLDCLRADKELHKDSCSKVRIERWENYKKAVQVLLQEWASKLEDCDPQALQGTSEQLYLVKSHVENLT